MVAPVKAGKKKLAGGKETTSKGGRPTVPSERRAMQAEVVRLRGMESLTFHAIELDALLPAILDRAFKGEL